MVPNRARVLVIRPDRLGDVILSTPVIEAIKANYPEAHVTFMVQDSLASLVRGVSAPSGQSRGADEVLSASYEKGLRGVLDLVQRFRKGSFDVALVLQSRWEIALALVLAGIKLRIGPLSKPHSFVLFNRGIRQRRSRVEMHEADYNLQLLRPLGIHVEARTYPVRVALSDETRAQARTWLQSRGWRPNSAAKLIAIHPGMGGSALNWPEQSYVELIRDLLREGHRVLVTSGPQEAELAKRISEALGGRRDTAIFYFGQEVKGLEFLAGLYSHVDLVVAPSTGPLHLAVALGKRVVCFYPSIRVQSPKRWGPYLADETRASVLVPHVYSEMNSISLEETLTQVRLQLSRG